MSAKLVICNRCGLHGHIVSSSGFSGPEFGCQQAAFRSVKTGIKLERLSPEEGENLHKAIINSELPFRYTEAPLLHLWKLEVLNQARAAGYLLETGFTEHDLIEGINCSELDIPSDFAQVIEAGLKSSL